MADDFLKIINKTASGIGGVNSFSTGAGSSSGVNTQDFINSIYTLSDSNVSTEQKVQKTTNFGLNFLLSLIGNNEEARATKEVNDNTKNAEASQKALTDAAAKTQSKVTDKIAEMEQNAQKIQEQIDKLEETSQEKENYQKQIEEKVQRLNAIKEEIQANPEKASEYVSELSEISTSIQDISSALEKLSSSVKENTNEVEDLQQSSSEANDDANDIVDNGIAEQQSIAQNVTNQQVVNSATGATGVVNNTQGVAAKAKATALEASSKTSSLIPGVGAIASTSTSVLASKLNRVSEDQLASGSIRKVGSASNATYLTGLNSMILTNLTDFSNFPTAIGSILSGTDSNVSEFTTFMQPVGEWLDNANSLGDEANTINEAADQIEENDTEGDDNDNQNSQSNDFNYDTDKLEEIAS